MLPVLAGKLTMAVVMQLIKKYWWILLVIAVVIYVYVLRAEIAWKTATIADQNTVIVQKTLEYADLKVKVEAQNKAIEVLVQNGKEQVSRLEAAVKRVNEMKPATQVTIREIYTDNAKTVHDLLLHALTD